MLYVEVLKKRTNNVGRTFCDAIKLWAEMQKQASDHSTSTDIGDVRVGYLKKAGFHVIFFKLTDSGIDVIRILHQRMDFDRHL